MNYKKLTERLINKLYDKTSIYDFKETIFEVPTKVIRNAAKIIEDKDKTEYNEKEKLLLLSYHKLNNRNLFKLDDKAEDMKNMKKDLLIHNITIEDLIKQGRFNYKEKVLLEKYNKANFSLTCLADSHNSFLKIYSMIKTNYEFIKNNNYRLKAKIKKDITINSFTEMKKLHYTFKKDSICYFIYKNEKCGLYVFLFGERYEFPLTKDEFEFI